MSKLQVARSLAIQRNFEEAAEIYSEILIEFDKNDEENLNIKRQKTDKKNPENISEKDSEKNISENSEKPSILIEYSHTLIKNAIAYYNSIISSSFSQNILNTNNNLSILINKKEQIENDLEIAWSSLEQARIFSGNFDFKAKIYFLQGEILLINENWQDAITCFSESIENIYKYEEFMKKENNEKEKNIEKENNIEDNEKEDNIEDNKKDNKENIENTFYFKYVTPAFIHLRIFDCYNFLKDKENANKQINLATDWYLKFLKKEKALKKIEKLEKLKNNQIDDDENENVDDEVKDVNHLLRKKV